MYRTIKYLTCNFDYWVKIILTIESKLKVTNMSFYHFSHIFMLKFEQNRSSHSRFMAIEVYYFPF